MTHNQHMQLLHATWYCTPRKDKRTWASRLERKQRTLAAIIKSCIIITTPQFMWKYVEILRAS